MKIFSIVLTCLLAVGIINCADTSEISVETLIKSELSEEKNLQITQSREAVYEQYPFIQMLSDRFGIKELEGAENLNDLVWFKNLHSLKEPIEILMTLSHALIEQKAFPYNQRQIARYIFRSSCDFDLQTLLKIDPNGSYITAFAETLIENGDYELLARFIERYSHFKYYNLFPGTGDSRFIEIFSNFAKLPFDDEETRISKLHTLAHRFYSNLNHKSGGPLVVSWSFMAGFPRQTYIDLLNDNSFMYLLDNHSLLFYLSTASQEKISEFRTLILENISSKEAVWRIEFANDPEKLNEKLNLLNGKRLLVDIATSDPEEDFYETRIKDQNIFNETLENLFFYSYRARKHKLTEKLLEQLIQTEFEGGYLPLNNYWLQKRPSFYLEYFYLLSEETRDEICSNLKFIGALFYFYNPEKVEISEEFILRIQLSKKKTQYESILPETFNYSYDIRNQRLNRNYVLMYMFRHYTLEDNEKFINFFKSLADHPYFHQNGDQQRIFYTSMKIIELFSESEELNNMNINMNLKFHVCYDKLAFLLQKPRPYMKICHFPDNLRLLVPKLYTKQQFENFEALIQKDIARIFLEDISESFRTLLTDLDYIGFRTAFRYWYEGPHRQRILEFEFPIFRIKFAREVETEAEREFLLQGITEEELSQASAAPLFEPAQN